MTGQKTSGDPPDRTARGQQPPDQDTAAARLFGIPELLEKILLDFLANDDQKIYLPARKLFVIQRVNSTFRNTIAGSAKLRRLMFLDPLSNADIKGPAPHPVALHWFFRVVGLELDELSRAKDFNLIIRPEHDLRDPRRKPAAFSSKFARRMDHPEASWRQMKALAPNDRFRYLWVDARFWRRRDEAVALVDFALRLEAGQGTTLGFVRDWYQTILNLTRDDCEADYYRQVNIVHGQGNEFRGKLRD